MSNSIGTYKYSSTEIKGYNISRIAKTETNDCFVRALAAATNMNYDTVHTFVKDNFGRKKGEGTKNIFIKTQMMKYEEDGMQVGDNEFKVTVLPTRRITNQYKLHGEVIDRKKTVKSFIKDNPIGTFIVGVAKHAFTVKDGVLIDNVGEEFRPTRKVDGAYEVAVTKLTEAQLTFNF